jgi:hypothetical protein
VSANCLPDVEFDTKIAVVLRDDLAVWQPAEDLDLVGIAVRAERKLVDKIVDRLKFHP